MGILKRKMSMLSSNSLKEMLKSTPKRSYRPETFAYSNKSKKTKFFCRFFADNFFRMSFFAIFSTE